MINNKVKILKGDCRKIIKYKDKGKKTEAYTDVDLDIGANVKIPMYHYF